MAYRRRRYHRVVPYAAGAAVAAARTGYSMAKTAISRWRKKLSSYRGKKRAAYRKRRRHPQKFLRAIGMTQNKVVTLVYRGSTIKDGPSGSYLTDLMYIGMNDPRDPGKADANVSSLWRKCAVGFDHMSSLYARWRCVSSVAYFNIRCARSINLQKTTSGTSVFDNYWEIPLKVGGVLAEGTAATGEGISAWDAAVMRDDPLKTLVYTMTDPLKSVNIKLSYNAKRWKGTNSDEPQFYWGSRTSSPSLAVNSCLWMQIADKASVPSQTKFLVTWTVKYKVIFSDFNGPEADMIQTTVPS